jgi:hypothetical protein
VTSRILILTLALTGAVGPCLVPSGTRAQSGGYLLVADYDNHKVLRYQASSGAFVDEFVPKHGGGLNQPQFLIFGAHDRSLYVGSGHFAAAEQHRAVLRYDGVTGAFLSNFAGTGHLDSTHGVIFGPDGNLYVGDRVGTFGQLQGGRVLRFDGTNGAFIDEFVPHGSGGLRHPFGMAFARDRRRGNRLDLFVCNLPGNVLRYDGVTGAFVGEFVKTGSGGLDSPIGMAFGPDGNLYLADTGVFNGISAVRRYQGPNGAAPGAFMDVFVPPGKGGLLATFALLFGPDGNDDGRQDLYVTSNRYTGRGADKGAEGTVKRYDGRTGAFLGDFVPVGAGGLNNASGFTFTDTDPMTLAYTGP